MIVTDRGFSFVYFHNQTRSQKMTLKNDMSELAGLALAGIRIESQEHADAVAELAGGCVGGTVAIVSTWDIERGLRGRNVRRWSKTPVIRCRRSGRSSLGRGEDTGDRRVCQNFHSFMQSAEIVQGVGSLRHPMMATAAWVCG